MKHRFGLVVLGLLWLGLIGLFTPALGQAHPVTFDFTGAVVAANPYSLGGIMTIPFAHLPASAISGSFTFDADQADVNGSSTTGQYNGAIQSLSLFVTKPITGDAYQFGFDSTGPLNSIQVNADPNVINQSYILSASMRNILPNSPIVDAGEHVARDFYLNLGKPTSSVFPDDALPETPPGLSPFSLYHATNNPQGQFRLVFASASGDHTIIGNLTSFTAAPVPLPAAAWLFGSGMIGVFALVRRKLRATA